MKIPELHMNPLLERIIATFHNKYTALVFLLLEIHCFLRDDDEINFTQFVDVLSVFRSPFALRAEEGDDEES